MRPAILLLMVLSVTVAGAAQAEPPTAAEASLLKAEDELFAAEVRHDVEVLARGFADEGMFVHADGRAQTKAEFLQDAAKARIAVKAIEATNRVVRTFGNVGVVRGTKTVTVGDRQLSGTYLTVYVLRDGRWQMLDEQSAPGPSPAP